MESSEYLPGIDIHALVAFQFSGCEYIYIYKYIYVAFTAFGMHLECELDVGFI